MNEARKRDAAVWGEPHLLAVGEVMTLLTGVGPEPMAPLADRLRAAGKLYQWLRPLLEEAAAALEQKRTPAANTRRTTP